MCTLRLMKRATRARKTGQPVKVGIRDLRNGLSEWIALVQDGQEILVTDRGRPVARLVGVKAERTLDRLIREGAVEPPRASAERAGLPPLIEIKGSVSEFVSEQRR